MRLAMLSQPILTLEWVSPLRTVAMAVVKVIPANVLGKGEVAFDAHAVQRMNERNITEAQVLATLKNPDITGLSAAPGRRRVRRHYGSHVSIDVVYEDEPNRVLVITAVRVTRSS
jgi:hypothetical protein